VIKVEKERGALPEQTGETHPEQKLLFYVLIHIP